MIYLLYPKGTRAFLPEVDAYMTYLRRRGYRSQAGTDVGYALRNSSVIVIFYGLFPFWQFLGCQRPRLIIGEYGSLSVGRLGRLKDIFKRTVNKSPHYTVALNRAVVDRLHLAPSGTMLRPMGFDGGLRDAALVGARKSYQFVYCGTISRPGVMAQLMSLGMNGSRVLIVGANRSDAAAALRAPESSIPDNITFCGRVSLEDAYRLMAKAEVGLNLMPDRRPWNIQDSTKVIEYASLGLPILSNRYQWIEDFSQEFAIRLAYLEGQDLRGSSSIEKSAGTRQIDDLEWDKVIDRSGIFLTAEFLKAAGGQTQDGP